MIPAWSHSSIETFRTCPRKYHAEKVLKTVIDTPGEARLYGLRVHKAFEDFQAEGSELPVDLRHHHPFMVEAQEGRLIGVEREVALDQQLEPCQFFGPKVWWRGVIDLHRDLGTFDGKRRCRVVDYKTGKQHSKMEQLHEYAIYAFLEGFDECEVMYYWTQSRQALPRVTLKRDRLMPLLDKMVPDLTQYVEAHKTGIWQPRQNGLCRKHCGVLDCEMNGRAVG